MQHFFADPACIQADKIYLDGPDANHMKNVLRMRPGEDVQISDGNGQEYLCIVDGYEGSAAVLDILKKLDAGRELPSRLYLFQGLPKGDKMDWVTQKAVELGAYEVVPFLSERCVSRPDAARGKKKCSRWQAIAKSAAEQSGRSIIPRVREIVSFEEALALARGLDHVLIPYELEEGMDAFVKAVSAVQPGESVGIFIGPEGGFSAAEAARAKEAGALPVSLGKRILRTETAGLAVLSVLMISLEAKSESQAAGAMIPGSHPQS